MSDPKRKAPAFPLYADDFLAGTSEMTCEEVGAYIRLLCHQWSKGGIPNDEGRVARMAGLMGSPSLCYVIAKFSLCDDGWLRNRRLESIRVEKVAYSEAQSQNGKIGAEKRWKNGESHGDPIGKPIATPLATPMARNSSPSPSPSPSPIPLPTPLNPLTPLQGEAVVSPQDENETPSATTTPPAPEKPQADGKAGESGEPKKRSSPMKIPTIEEVKLHAAKIGLPETEAFKFHGYYESNGWRVGKNPMKSWVGAMTSWKGNYDERARGSGGRFSGGGSNRPGNGPDGNPRNAGIAGFTEWNRDFQARAVGDGQHGPWDDFGRGPSVEEKDPETGRVAPPPDRQAGAGR